MEDEGTVDQFTLNRARLLLSGTIIPDRVKYFVQTEAKDGEGLLDYKASFYYLPNTEIAAGRFLPNFTLYMPMSTGKLELIDYPMTTTYMIGNEEASFAMWRQTGIQSTTKMELFDFNIGVFNGADVPNNTMDNNDAKDFFGRVDVKIPGGEDVEARVGAYGWLGSAKAIDPNPYDDSYGERYRVDEDDTVQNNMFGGFGTADADMGDMSFSLRGELVVGRKECLVMRVTEKTAADSPYEKDETKSAALLLQAGVKPLPKVEGICRLESIDPNGDVDNDAVGQLTLGANYYLDGLNAMFYLNFIHTYFEDDDIDAVDTIKAQMQIMF